jgi:phosphopantetheinyl transferase
MRYMTKSQINNDFIYTIASLKNNEEVLSITFELEDSLYLVQHKESYKKLIATISKKLELPIENIYIEKDRVGVPKLFLNTKQLNPSFSITHHGNYGGYSILN